MKILHVCAEFFPLLKTGGLADVTGALPQAQNKIGNDARVILPGFPAIKAGIKDSHCVVTLDTFAGQVNLRFGKFNDVGVYYIDAPHLYDREGSPYHDKYFNSYHDNDIRFAILSWVACEIACGADYYWKPDIVHSHDWHAGLTSAYLASKSYWHNAKSVFTIHNLAYHGSFSNIDLRHYQLPVHYYDLKGLEFNGQVSYLKAGIYYSNYVTTVSPTYAREITTSQFGNGFEGLLANLDHENRLSGVLNGLDDTIWNPRVDDLISQNYNAAKDLKLKGNNKRALQMEFGLAENSDQLLFGVISRLTSQKGLDIVLETLPEILDRGGQFILLGSGDDHLQKAFSDFAKQEKYKNQIAIYLGYDEALSHRIIAGSDVILVPSRFEPCGLTQLYALKYGSLPIVRATGGLADTVTDSSNDNLKNKTATGFSFRDADVSGLLYGINRAFTLWDQPAQWRLLQQRAMKQEFSWKRAAKTYNSIYQLL